MRDMNERLTTFSFNLKAHVTQYTGDKAGTADFVKKHLLAPNVVSDGDGSELRVKYEGEAGDRIVVLKTGMYVVVLFDRVYALQEDQFGQFMATCS